jgi:hypothetical protein
MPDDNVIHVGAAHRPGDKVSETLLHQTYRSRIAGLEAALEFVTKRYEHVKDSNRLLLTAAMKAGVVFSDGESGLKAEHKPDLAKTLLHLDALPEDVREEFLKEVEMQPLKND